ncbi:MAG: mannose-1-phosphate guanylyltransferase [Spirochaetaceae bacterium]|nr:mannose-1-phosphate guanylyltransferase [Spirochaetaceae bacterium]
MFTDAVILAGGFGERLWPASSPSYPKQFLSLEDGISFLQASVLRAVALNLTGKILIITRKDLLDLAAEQCSLLIEGATPEIKKKLQEDLYIIAEPKPKHTAAPGILACHFLEKTQPEVDHSILILTSDHVIGPTESFVNDCKVAYECATQDNFVCFAIPPTEVSTGFGYIKTGDKLNISNAFKIAEFKEKPNLETAKKYIESGNYWWNSGMFAFTSKFFIQELKKCDIDVYNAFLSLPTSNPPKIGVCNGIKFVESWQSMDEAYEKTPAISMDNAVAERTTCACAVKASFSWDDVGSWDAFEKLFAKNTDKTELINCENCFVYSDIPVAICGVDDLVVVIKNGKALVMKKGSSSLVREAAKRMKDSE